MNIIEKIEITIEVVKSFFSRGNSVPSRCLPVKPYRQWTPYSCCASVFQMVAAYYGVRVSHLKAIKLTRCHPDGASLTSVARVLKREYRLRPKHLTSKRQVRAALKRGEPVISNDSLTYEDDHAILVVGQTAKGFYCVDPVLGQVRWKHQQRFMAGAHEFIAVRA